MRESETLRGWEGALERWLAPFLSALGREAQRRWAPVYLKGLILPGGRKSVEPLAARVAPDGTEQLHHFIGGSPWATGPLEAVLAEEADRLVGGPEAVLVVDDTALPEEGKHSGGAAAEDCGRLGPPPPCGSRASTRSGGRGGTAAASASAPTARSRSRSPWPGARCRCPWGCACSCRPSGPPIRGAAPAPACPRSTAARWRSRRSRSRRWTGPSPPACASAACWPTPATVPAPPSAGAWTSAGCSGRSAS